MLRSYLRLKFKNKSWKFIKIRKFFLFIYKILVAETRQPITELHITHTRIISTVEQKTNIKGKLFYFSNFISYLWNYCSFEVKLIKRRCTIYFSYFFIDLFY